MRVGLDGEADDRQSPVAGTHCLVDRHENELLITHRVRIRVRVAGRLGLQGDPVVSVAYNLAKYGGAFSKRSTPLVHLRRGVRSMFLSSLLRRFLRKKALNTCSGLGLGLGLG